MSVSAAGVSSGTGVSSAGVSGAGVVGAMTAPTTMQSSVTQHGITWTFDASYPVGQYANGDYFVIGPVTITAITRPQGVSTQDGTMVNPSVGGSVSQGFDSRIQDNSYSGALNIANSLPYIAATGTSVVSALSHAALQDGFYYLSTIAVLTVVDAAPAMGAFRPPYVGTDKTVVGKESDLDYTVLPNLASVTGAPTLSTVAADFAKPWIEIRTNWQGRYWHPTNNQPGYGRDMSREISAALLRLCISDTSADKRDAMVNLVQYGIDIYGTLIAGGAWNADGGHNMGRKGPLLLAAYALDNTSMLAYVDKTQHFKFQEDQQTWAVQQSDVGRSVTAPRETYTQSYVGLPEWGEKHTEAPSRDDSRWDATYRGINGSGMAGIALFASMVGAKTDWNWDVFFDYHDRFMDRELGPNGPVDGSNQVPTFVKNMWTTYRSSYPPVWS